MSLGVGQYHRKSLGESELGVPGPKHLSPSMSKKRGSISAGTPAQLTRVPSSSGLLDRNSLHDDPLGRSTQNLFAPPLSAPRRSSLNLSANKPSGSMTRSYSRGSNLNLDRRQSSLHPHQGESNLLSARKTSLPYLASSNDLDDGMGRRLSSGGSVQNFEELQNELHKDRVRTKLSSVMNREDAIMLNKKAKIRDQLEHIQGLSPEQKEFYADAFSMFDVDGDGTIDMSEIKQVSKSMGIDITDKEIILMVKHVDDDGNGAISLEEFVHFLGAIVTKEKRSSSFADDRTLEELFASMDLDRDGYLGVNDIIGLLSYFGEKATPEAAAELIWAIDMDYDNKVSMEEFLKMLNGSLFD